MNTYLLPLQNFVGLLREAWGTNMVPMLVGLALVILVLVLLIERGTSRRFGLAARGVDIADDDDLGSRFGRVGPGVDEWAMPTQPANFAPSRLQTHERAGVPPGRAMPIQALPEQPGRDPGPPRVLIVDDSAVVRLKLRRLLEAAGYRAETAGNGLEALDALGTAFFSVLITDLEMPEMSGFELIASVHGSIATEDLPIIAITGHDELQSRVHEYTGLYGLFRKPWNDREMLRRVESLATLRREVGTLAGKGLTSAPMPL